MKADNEWVELILRSKDEPIEDVMSLVNEVGVAAAMNALFDAGMRSHNDPAKSSDCVLLTVRIMRYLW